MVLEHKAHLMLSPCMDLHTWHPATSCNTLSSLYNHMYTNTQIHKYTNTQIHKYTNIHVHTCMHRCAPCHLIQCRTTMSTQLQVPPMCHIYMLFSLEYVESNTVLIVVWLYKVSQVGGGSRHWGRMELGLLGDLFWRRMGIFLKAA